MRREWLESRVESVWIMTWLSTETEMVLEVWRGRGDDHGGAFIGPYRRLVLLFTPQNENHSGIYINNCLVSRYLFI